MPDGKPAPPARYHAYTVTNAEWLIRMGIEWSASAGTRSSANGATYCPFEVLETITASGLFCISSNTAGNDNFDIGIYASDSSGLPSTKLTSTGATATATANTAQFASCTAYTLSPGLYYFGFSSDGTTDSYSLFTTGNTVYEVHTVLASVFQEASAYPLPSTATPVLGDSNLVDDIPYLGLQRGSTLS